MLRKDLAEDLRKLFTDLSDFDRLRNIPQPIADSVRTRWQNRCAICHKNENTPGVHRPQVAHIKPVSISLKKKGKKNEFSY
jgi:hypothetical protein